MMKIMYFFILALSINMSLSGNNMMMNWMALEMNMITFIPLIMNKFNYKLNSLTLMKYFMVQSLASMLFFTSMVVMIISINLNIYMLFYLALINSMFMKLGMPPFYLWYINMMKMITWINCMILSTLQKIIPLIILMKTLQFSYLFPILIMVSSIISILNGLKQTLLKLIMSFSSINHLSWIILIMMINEKFMIVYFLIYSLISLNMMMIFNIYNIKLINEIYNLNLNNYIKLLIFINMMSLGGMPPFLGFLMKWFSLKNFFMMNLSSMIMMMILLLNSTFTLLYYMNIIFPMMFMFNFKTKNFNLNYMNTSDFLLLVMFTSLFFISMNSLL